eukprot:4785163-Ditylum_brightwellii.AAC.1
MAINVMLHCDQRCYQSAYKQNSKLSRLVNRLTKKVLRMLCQVPQLPHHSFLVATLPKSLKGLGLFAPHRSDVASFTVPDWFHTNLLR